MSRRKSAQTQLLSADVIQNILDPLDRGTPVRRKLPDEGRVHVDRQLPFLAVYRRPYNRPDRGTERLLLGEASYLVMQGGRRRDAALTSLLTGIIRTQHKAFDAYLLLELWSAEGGVLDQGQVAAQPAFRIYAPRHETPAPVLEELENGLLDVEVAGRQAQVALTYADTWKPPGLQTLLTRSDIRRLGCTVLGLEVQPVYRNVQTQELLPFELQTLHQALARALKRSFHAFAHACTKQRPVHYHQLGRRAMTSAVWETDRRLAEIDSSFDILLDVSPVNVDAAFAKCKRRHFTREPEFLYRPREVDPSLLKRRLYRIPLERIEDPTLAHIFHAKRDELDRQLTLIADRGTPRFLHGSLAIYGRPESHVLEQARRLLRELPPHSHDAGTSHAIGAQEFARRAAEELAHYRGQYSELGARVEVRKDVPGVLVSRGHLLVGSRTRVPKARVQALLAHEVGTHILTFYNGRAQPLQQLKVGMANYEALQEGLAVLAEYLVGEIGRPRLRLLAGRVIAAECITQGADFLETYRELHDTFAFNQSEAFMIAMRIFRGGGYVKDVVYLRGLIALLDYLKQDGDLELLYLGKVAMEHLPFVEELRWREVLKPNLLRPRYLDQPQAAERRARLNRGVEVLDLLEDLG